jgi:uracil-DNA glycosylase
MSPRSKSKQMESWFEEIGINEVIGYTPINKLDITDSLIINKNESIIKGEEMTIKNLNILIENLGNSRKIANACGNLNELIKAIKDFDECGLKHTANNAVIGEGIVDAEILVMGEAPGAQEDLEGRPFCGDSGKLLDLMLSSIGLSRSKNIFITNTVFWRPPANRKPTNQELVMCLPFIERIISFIKPKLILMVGSVSSSNLTGQNIPMSELRKKPHEYSNQYLKHMVNCFSIFHPAFLLRQPSQKKTTWFDLLNIKEFIVSNNIKN